MMRWHHNKETTLAVLMATVSFLGFADATYLTAHALFEVGLTCFIVSGCDVVTKSAYASWGPIPVAAVGMAYYLSIFLSCIAFFDTRKSVFLKTASFIALFCFPGTLWFLAVQAVILKAYCFWCLVSATFSTILFICACMFFMQRGGVEKKKKG